MSNLNWTKQVAATTSRRENHSAVGATAAAPATEAELEAIRYRGAPPPRTVSPVVPLRQEIAQVLSAQKNLGNRMPAGADATALTNPAPANAAAPDAKALSAKTALTPAVTVASPAPPAGETIRDSRQPRHFPTPWLWGMVAAGVCTLVAGAWRWLRHDWLFEMSAAEIAVQRIEEARRLMDPEHAREYCCAVSHIIRGYIEEQLRLRAPRLTTEEFLRELVAGRAEILAAHRALLGDFLQHCELAKFAGWRCSPEALADMHVTAIEFVQQSSVTPAAATSADSPTAPAPAPENTLANNA